MGTTVRLVPLVSVINDQEIFNLLGRKDELGRSHGDVVHRQGRATLLICIDRAKIIKSHEPEFETPTWTYHTYVHGESCTPMVLCRYYVGTCICSVSSIEISYCIHVPDLILICFLLITGFHSFTVVSLTWITRSYDEGLSQS